MDEQLYKHIIGTLPHALFVLDKELRVVVANRSAEVLVRRSAGKIVGTGLSEVIPHKDLKNQAQAVLQNGGTKVVELHLNIDEGAPQILRAVVTALDRVGGDPLCLIILEDIGERVRLEQQLVQSEKLAGMGLLARSVAHEIGNPLAIMASTLQYVRDALLKTEDSFLTEAIETLMDSVGQIDELLRSLSEFTGSQRSRFESTDLCHILSQMLGFIRREAEQHNVRIYRQFEDHLPTCQVDPGEMKQLFLNLLKNAIEAMSDGGELRVTMGFVPGGLSDSEDMIRVEISDTGPGISETELRSIFRPFYSTKPGGMGLGLSFCRRVVEEHGGEITVNSRPGEGSSFIVTLPVDQGGEV
ncbi:MAG: PAS domain-containing protein [Candidatus Latescibacteria bacterium]|nr:PAS domain-containing protein [Candidatus Latescibacterota bacterium]